MNMNLTDTTSLNELFKKADGWSAMPLSALSEQQIAVINLRNAVALTENVNKNGGGLSDCFICFTGA